MKRIHWFSLCIILLFVLHTITACNRKEIPVLTTNVTVQNVTEGSAVSGGRITSDGGSPVTERGVCWSLSANPTRLLITKTNDGHGIGSFTSYISGLTYGKTYHIRAYATNSLGTAYGADVLFTTKLVVAPTVTTTPVSAIASKEALSGGNVTDKGGAEEIMVGVCWSKSPEPTLVSSEKTIDFGEAFTSIISGLTAGTLYYVRAYAANVADTSYGNQVSFTTIPGVTDIEGTVYGTVNIGTQVWLTENLATATYNDGSSIPLVTEQTAWNSLTTPGYCWYNNDRSTYRINNGALYNWHVVSSGKLCPAGWHVPSDGEWTTLSTFLGGESLAGDKMKAGRSDPGNSLFRAVPCGIRDTIVGFVDPNTGCETNYDYWWSSTSSKTSTAWSRRLSSSPELFRVEFSKRYGYSVRCLKD
jgi:uncharacterized protein (TIGR02145 family)